MQLLVTLTAAISLASTILALNIPSADIPNVHGGLVKRATKKCTYTTTITEKYSKSGKAATKTVFKEVVANPTGIDCDGRQCAVVVVKTVTKGTPVKTVYGSITTVNRPHCTPLELPQEEEEEEEEEEEGEEEEEE
ncbi:hypothetical protein TWF281_005359 [Arthrobotrys megalospora]